jgi:nucleotide-binding universal stress UspA family protein
LSEAVLPVAAAISANLSSPLPGALHLAMMVPEPLQEHGKTTGTYTKAIQGAQSYLNRLSKRLRRDPQVGSTVEITSSISLQSKVSETLVKLAEIGAEMEGVSPFTGYDLIAMAAHGQEDVDRWLYASATEQVLDATKVPVLVLRPEQAKTGVVYNTNNAHYGSFAV